MDKFNDFRKPGFFLIADGTELHGELVLKRGATSLNLYSTSAFHTLDSKDILGTFHDRSKVSLIGCITLSGPGTGYRGSETYHFSTLFPHFALLGGEHVTSEERKITGVSFSVDDATAIFYDFDAFGMVIDARPHLQQILDSQPVDRKVEIGDHPKIFYFTGKYEIFRVRTAIGDMSATHGPSYDFPSPKGIHVENTIRINIDFDANRTVEEAVDAVRDALRFFDMVAGRPQNIVELKCHLASTEEERYRSLDVYWCMPPHRDEADESGKPHPADLPVKAAKDPAQFTPILANWLHRQVEWRTARARFAFAAAHQNRYTTDRLVGAANMFDIMPASAYPSAVTLPSDLEKARDEARAAFRSLPGSPERESVLNALGRIGKPTLKRKIRTRVELLKNAVGTRFPDLELVTDQAVDCRNFYVHGSPGKFDYEVHSDQPTFFTDTLEFVFAASDLIEAGWNMASWIQEGTTMSHPFGRYRVTYKERLAALKKLLEQR